VPGKLPGIIFWQTRRAAATASPRRKTNPTAAAANGLEPPNAFVIWLRGVGRTFAANKAKAHALLSTLIEARASFDRAYSCERLQRIGSRLKWRRLAISNEEPSDV
jgi:hypothetical protein